MSQLIESITCLVKTAGFIILGFILLTLVIGVIIGPLATILCEVWSRLLFINLNHGSCLFL
jgi:hypothetical protein